MTESRRRRRGRNKRPSADNVPLPQELRPVADPELLREQPQRVRFSLRFVDTNEGGKFGWPPSADESVLLLNLFHEMSQRTWDQVHRMCHQGQPLHHAQGADEVSAEAQRRVLKLRLEDHGFEDFFRFTVTTTGRLWGFISPVDDAFEVLWWDPYHQVYPRGN